MCQLKPLQSSLGKPAEGDDNYFSRPHITKKIRREITNGENILISAPRRIGKSSMLKDIQANPDSDPNKEQGQIIKYLFVQSVDNSKQFFRQLFTELIRDDAIYSGAEAYYKHASYALKVFFSKLRGVSIEGGLNIDAHDSINYYHECNELLSHLKDKSLLVIIDEFPDALNNIYKEDHDLSIQFLQQHRDLRQKFSEANVQFIYTGSTGLRNVVTKIGKLDLINDLVEITVPPFSKNEAKCLIQCLQLGYQQEEPDFELTPQQIDYILEKITWYLPFYLQAIVHALFNRYEDTHKTTAISDIDVVLLDMTKAKSPYSPYFENWLKRLEQAFDKEELKVAIEILNHIAINHKIDETQLKELTASLPTGGKKFIMQTLEYDGYINEHSNEQYQFNSILLKKWWVENVVK